MTLGDKIRKLRTDRKMTMEELADLIGVQRSAVNKYEKGIVVNLKRSTIASLARVFNVPPSYFLDDDDSPEITDDERDLLTAYRKADPGTQASIRKLLDIPDKKDIGQTAI